jgi:hypothetical protein
LEGTVTVRIQTEAHDYVIFIMNILIHSLADCVYVLCNLPIVLDLTAMALEEKIYMRQPDGFHLGKPHDVLHLVKSLYGLKQVGQVWFLELSCVLKEKYITRLKFNASLFVWRKDDIRLIMPVFTDDVTIALPSTASEDQVVAKLL